MNDNIYNIEDYYNLLEIQKKYEEELITEDDMTIEKINNLIKLYTYQNKQLKESIKNKLLQKSKEWYK